MINYINGDEALFEDASLPRDRFGFRIANGVNTRKQDWKTANSGIMMAQYVAMSMRRVESQDINSWRGSEFTKADTGDIKTTRLGNPYCEIDGNDVKITKSGLYLLQAQGVFVFDYFYKYSDGQETHGCAMKIGIGQKVSGGYEWLVGQTGKQGCKLEMLEVNYYGWLGAGTCLNVGFNSNPTNSSGSERHQYTCQTALNLYRLS